MGMSFQPSLCDREIQRVCLLLVNVIHPPRLIYCLNGPYRCHELLIPQKLQKLGKAAARKLKKDAGEEKEALKIMNLQFFGRKWEVLNHVLL